jgi:hypothetical protein
MNTRYNQLLDDVDQPKVSQTHLETLAGIFVRHDVHRKFGLHLIHRHLKIDDNMVMLGKKFAEPTGCWTKPTHIEGIDPKNVHGHVFILSTDGPTFTAYEYREGAPIEMNGVSPAFFQDLSQYLQANNLVTVLGLQILGDNPSEQMIELVLQNAGTVMLTALAAKCGSIYRVTGWHFDSRGGIAEFKGGESHAKTTKGTHQVFIDGKPLPDLDSLKDLLREEGIIEGS